MRLRLTFLLIGCLYLELPAQITFNNQLEFTYWEEYKRDILENWSDLTYQYKALQLGARYEINNPPDPFIFPLGNLVKKYDLTYFYARLQHNQFTAVAGNYYAMFGRGLTLRTYEDRNLRVDKNLRGTKVSFNSSSVNVQALAGQMRDKYNRREDWLYGVDAEIIPLEGLHLGATWLYEQENKRDNSQLWSCRINYVHDWFDLYGEAVRPEWTDTLSYYLAMSISLEKLTLTTEFKNYSKLSFINAYETEYNAAPALAREHTFSLLNRHPHVLDMNDEKGYQVEAVYSFTDETEILFNHSQTFKQNGKRTFSEYYGEWHHIPGERFDYRLAAALSYTTDTRNITPLADCFINLSERDQIHTSYQHQHTKNLTDLSEFDNELLLLEYTRAPLLSLAVVGEYTNKNQLRNIEMKRHTWLYGQITLNFLKNQQLSVLYGSRQEGFICVGGICRYEPEFKGLEIKLTNRF